MSKHTKRVTFDPRARNQFRFQIDGVPQTGKAGLVTRKEALSLVSQLAASGATVVVGPKESRQQKPSYFKKRRRSKRKSR
jgi:hypothetical protein